MWEQSIRSCDPKKDLFRVIEFFCGIGGCAAALEGKAQVILAVDQNRNALATYALNFDHRICPKTIESLPVSLLKDLDAHLWWCSPPCQPFTIKGAKKDLNDPRTKGFVDLMDKLKVIQPTYFAMENVLGFRDSNAHYKLQEALEQSGYGHIVEMEICPTQLGIPNRRPRFYLLAGHSPLKSFQFEQAELRPLKPFLGMARDSRLDLDPDLRARFQTAIHLVDPKQREAVTRCFTASYGCSTVRSGSYVARETGGVRLFSPREIANLLGFPSNYSFPPNLSNRQKWRLLGNSLSVPVVRQFLTQIPELSA